MALTFSTALGNAILDLINAYVNSGSGAGKIRFYATADTTYTTILAEITCRDPAFNIGAGGVITLQGTPLSDSSANNSGTVGVFRFVDSDNNFEFRGTCSLSGGGGDLILSTLAVTAGQVFTISSATISVPVAAT
jgi:hypothetical protein